MDQPIRSEDQNMWLEFELHLGFEIDIEPCDNNIYGHIDYQENMNTSEQESDNKDLGNQSGSDEEDSVYNDPDYQDLNETVRTRKDCHGSTICEHDNKILQTSHCKHGKRRRQCKDCGGSSICKHNLQKSFCKKCNGSVFCIHGRQKYVCKECKGKGICQHNKIKAKCRECKGSDFCEHGNRKYYCKQCVGRGICKHGKVKRSCKHCGIYEKNKCPHGKRKDRCKNCREKKN